MASLTPEMNDLSKIIDDLRGKVSDVQAQQRRQEVEMGALRAQVEALNRQIKALQNRTRTSNTWTPLGTPEQHREWMLNGLCSRCGGCHMLRKCPYQPFKNPEKSTTKSSQNFVI
ncbi:hypothetical protein MGN70_002493 [Eutypa lata]|nr:hypothetical protein MGN70_002493 [Eutypa lata]